MKTLVSIPIFSRIILLTFPNRNLVSVPRPILLSAQHSTSKMKPKIFATRSDFPAIGIDSLKDLCELSIWNQEEIISKSELIKNVKGMDGIICSLNDKIDSDVLDSAGSNLKVIGTMSVGYDHIDVVECKKRNIRIGYTPDVLTDASAELTVALLLTTSRRLIEANKEVYNGGWKSWSPLWMCGQGLKNSVVGIVGFGRIGQEVAKRLYPFKPNRIIYANRSDKSEEAKCVGGIRVSYDELFEQSDFVILTCALTPETTRLINADTLEKMKSNAILINTSRGPVVDQNDLYDALKSKRILAAGLDVTTPEPLPLNSPLLSLDNCVVLPHIGSADTSTRTEMSRITGCNILAGLNGTEMIAEI